MPTPTRDRFDDIPPSRGRVGAHRAENPRPRGWVTFLWAAAATIVLTTVGVFGVMIAQGTISLFPEPAPTISAAPTVEPEVDMSYSVLVLNGTQEEGLATRIKDELIAQQWSEELVIASNAGQRDVESTTVYYAAPEAQAAALGLAELIGGAAVMEDADYPLPGTPATQLTLVVGADRATGTDAPSDGTEGEQPQG